MEALDTAGAEQDQHLCRVAWLWTVILGYCLHLNHLGLWLHVHFQALPWAHHLSCWDGPGCLRALSCSPHHTVHISEGESARVWSAEGRRVWGHVGAGLM